MTSVDRPSMEGAGGSESFSSVTTLSASSTSGTTPGKSHEMAAISLERQERYSGHSSKSFNKSGMSLDPAMSFNVSTVRPSERSSAAFSTGWSDISDLDQVSEADMLHNNTQLNREIIVEGSQATPGDAKPPKPPASENKKKSVAFTSTQPLYSIGEPTARPSMASSLASSDDGYDVDRGGAAANAVTARPSWIVPWSAPPPVVHKPHKLEVLQRLMKKLRSKKQKLDQDPDSTGDKNAYLWHKPAYVFSFIAVNVVLGDRSTYVDIKSNQGMRTMNISVASQTLEILRKESRKMAIPFEDIEMIGSDPNADSLRISLVTKSKGTIECFANCVDDAKYARTMLVAALSGKFNSEKMPKELGMVAHLPMLKRGWVLKRGRRVFSSRLFVLYPTKLYGFRYASSSVPIYSFTLLNSSVLRVDTQEIVIRFTNRSVLFRCRSEEERDDWCERLLLACRANINDPTTWLPKSQEQEFKRKKSTFALWGDNAEPAAEEHCNDELKKGHGRRGSKVPVWDILKKRSSSSGDSKSNRNGGRLSVMTNSWQSEDEGFMLDEEDVEEAEIIAGNIDVVDVDPSNVPMPRSSVYPGDGLASSMNAMFLGAQSASTTQSTPMGSANRDRTLSTTKPKKAKDHRSASALRRADPVNTGLNVFRALTSKKKRRYQEDGFDLDLTYVNHNLIAMGYPSKKLEGLYRNPMPEVQKFLELKHSGHYKVYNLCSERQYPASKFHNMVERFPFDDHNAPPLDMIITFCENAQAWLSSNPQNVAVVHCKAGKGRTGLMLCCFLLHVKEFDKANDALRYFDCVRTLNRKGVTIPSQRRYVNYYEKVVREGCPKSFPRRIKLIRLFKVPRFDKWGGCEPYFLIRQENSVFCSKDHEESVNMYKDTQYIEFDCKDLSVRGDVKILFFHAGGGTDEHMFHFWFRPDMHDGDKIVLGKFELDKAHKDKHHKLYSEDFRIELHFEEEMKERRRASILSGSAHPVYAKHEEATCNVFDPAELGDEYCQRCGRGRENHEGVDMVQRTIEEGAIALLEDDENGEVDGSGDSEEAAATNGQ